MFRQMLSRKEIKAIFLDNGEKECLQDTGEVDIDPKCYDVAVSLIDYFCDRDMFKPEIIKPQPHVIRRRNGKRDRSKRDNQQYY